MTLRGAAAAFWVAFAIPWGSAALAQDGPQVLRSPVVTLDQERLFEESLRGRAALERIEAETAALAAENRRIEADLIEEERELTEQRASLPPEEFRALANAFDEKVVAIRRAQDTKAANLARRQDRIRQDFYREALPIVAELVAERGAVAVLDRAAVILSAEQIDITGAAIALIDQRTAPDDADVDQPD